MILFKRLSLTVVFVALVACGTSGEDGQATPLMFEAESGDFFFTDAGGNRVIYQRAENTLIVEPEIDLDALAMAYCKAEITASDPARFASVGLVLAEGIDGFISAAERICDR